jgi:hypothetical protein
LVQRRKGIDQDGMTVGRSAGRSLVRNVTANRWSWQCASCVPDFRFGQSQRGTHPHPDHE